MIKHRLFSKGEYIHALVSNTTFPNIVFPVKAIIYDVKFDEKMPKYQIRITKFYDDLAFLKRYFFDTNFEKNFNGANTKFRFKRSQFSTKKELQDHLEANAETYLITVDSIMCTKTSTQVVDLYNNIQDFLVEKQIRELYELTTRQVYKDGQYYYETRGVFEAHLKKMLDVRAPKQKDYFDRLLYRPSGPDLDNLNL